jgi:hypothetical protein
MSLRTKRSFGLEVESLQVRELLSANVLAAGLHLPTDAAHAALTAAPMAVDYGSALKSTAPSHVAQAAIGFDQTYTVSVVTIQNRTANTVNFQLQWPGTAWYSYSLKPGETRLYWITGSQKSALIRYDCSYAPGYQEQSWTLTSKSFAAGGFADLTPSRATDGQQYYFTTNAANTGLSFYHL